MPAEIISIDVVSLATQNEVLSVDAILSSLVQIVNTGNTGFVGNIDFVEISTLANQPFTIFDVITAYLTNANCPPLPTIPASGQRSPALYGWGPGT